MKPTIINLCWKELGYPRQNFWASAEAQTSDEISKAREMVKDARMNNGVHNLRVKIHRGRDVIEADNGERQRALSPATCSASRVVVTQNMVNEIVRRAKDSQWGLSEEPKASLSLLFYEAAPMDALALVLVNGFEAKYDLVSIFSAALSVIAEQTPNGRTELSARVMPTAHNNPKI